MNKKQEQNVRGWIADLRSGEYKQGMKSLWREEEGERCYCCLGVATHRLDPNSKRLEPAETEPYKSVSNMPDPFIMENIYGISLDYCRSLAEMNDNGDSFYFISIELEKKLKRETAKN